MENINVVALTVNLTRDPEMRTTVGGTQVASMRGAYNTRRKDPQTGQWMDKPNYVDLVAFGSQAQLCQQYLHKGKPAAIIGRLEYSEWQAKDGSGTRSKHEVVIDKIQFLHNAPPGGYGQQGFQQAPPPQQGGYPQGQPQPQGWGQGQPPQGAPPQQPPPQQGQQQQVWSPPPQQQAPPPQPQGGYPQGDPMRPDTAGMPPAQPPGAPPQQGQQQQGVEDDIPF